VYDFLMTALRGTAIASTVITAAAAVILATSGHATTVGPANQTVTPTATPTGSSAAASRERPRGVVADCAKGSGIGRGGSLNSVFRSRWNLVIGPLAMTGAATTPGYYSPEAGGNKFPLYVRAGHRVTLALTRATRGRAGLHYSPLPNGAVPVRDGYRVITFISCRRGEFSPGLGSNAGRLSFWAGGVVAPAPLCVPLLVWVDDEPSPQRGVIDLGAGNCG
jgi:hypothetical protein